MILELKIWIFLMFLMYHINVKNKFKNIILIYFKLSLKKPNTVKKKKKNLGYQKAKIPCITQNL
jgi:hypothetical protein